MSCSESPEFIPQSSRSTSEPSTKRNTLTRPSSNGIGSRSSKTPSATSVSAVTIRKFSPSAVGLRWEVERVRREAAAQLFQEEPMSDVQVSPQEVFDRMPEALIPEKAGATKAMIQFDLSGDHGGKWWVQIHDGKAESGKGDAPENANLTLLADSGDFVKIMLGQMDGMSAFMSRKLQVKGDMGLAVKLQTLFKRPS